MRATSNPPTPFQIADQVWDEAVAAHVVLASFGEYFGTMTTRVGVINSGHARRTPYTYGPTGLAAGATYVPVAGTVITCAVLDGVAVNDFQIVHGIIPVYEKLDNSEGYFGFIYCDGTNIGIKNADGVQRDLSIEGMTP